jgi:hypothetical protein
MERNEKAGNLGDASGAGQGGAAGGAGGTGGYGGTSGFGGASDTGASPGGFSAPGGGGSAGSTAGGGATGGYGGTSGGEAGGATGLGDRAKNVAGSAQERLSDVGSTVRERAGQAKNTLADALEAGAERLRNRSGQQLAGSTGYGQESVSTDGTRVAEIGQRVAGGLQSSADWLREADIDGLRQGVERQVRENPGRTLLIAVGLGYLLGKAFRR